MGAIGVIPNLGGIINRPSAPPLIQGPTIDTSDWGSTIGSLIGTGLQAWQTDLQSNLLQSQINHGQAPSIVAGPNGTPSAGYSYAVDPRTGAVSFSAGNGIGASANAAGALGSLFGSPLIWLVLLVVVIFAVARR